MNQQTAAPPRPKKPVPVVDVAAALAAALQLADEHALSASTLKTYRKHWRLWERICREEGCLDPYAADFDTLKAILGMRTESGKPVSPDYVEHVAKAVAYEYVKRGLTPLHRDPRNEGAWRELMRGYKRRHSKQTAAKTRRESPADAVPMMREDAVRLLSVELPWVVETLARKAATLLVLDGILPVRRVKHVTVEDVVFTGGAVTVDGVPVPCDHAERVRGVPWDCTACTLRELAPLRQPGVPLLVDEGRPFDRNS